MAFARSRYSWLRMRADEAWVSSQHLMRRGYAATSPSATLKSGARLEPREAPQSSTNVWAEILRMTDHEPPPKSPQGPCPGLRRAMKSPWVSSTTCDCSQGTWMSWLG